MLKTKIKLLLLFKTCIFILVISLILFPQKALAQDLEEALLKKDLTISIGGGKNRYYIPEFQLFAPLSIPLTVNYAFFKSFELGLMYQPSFFNDRSNADFQRGETAKNQSLGGVQSAGFNSKISLFNENGIFAFMETGLMFSELKKNQFIEGVFHEKHGTGRQIMGGFGVRYHLGDEFGTIYPWFFEFSALCSQHKFDIHTFRIESETQPSTDSNWQDLKFGALDINIKFGYRFRKK
jgi:hypothetical protein